MTYPLDKIRADFPALALRPYNKPLAFLDNAASAQKPQIVIDRMAQAYAFEYANVHRGLHFLANKATDGFEAGRESVRQFINAPHVDTIIFAKNATEAFNLLASSLGLSFKEGDEILLSILEHHSNIVPWHFLRERKGCVLKFAPVDEEGNFLIEEFEKLITPRTKIISLTHMSNALGTIVPIKEAIALAHKHGVPVIVDGSQAAVHLDVDVQDLDADFYVMTGHKLYGPTGIGVLYGKLALLKTLPPFLGGGEMIETVTTEGVTYAAPPHRFEAGTPPIVEAMGLGVACDYIQTIGRPAIRAHENTLVAYAHERLSRINRLHILGKAKEKGAIVSFYMEGVHAHDLATLIDREGVAVRAGTHCTMPLMQRFGLTSTCRASFALYNRLEEVDQLAEALIKAQRFF
jgi:cysteine desulfurase / selenocysteine lyase